MPDASKFSAPPLPPASAGAEQGTRLLMELRTCFEGFAGIPQETRLLFSSFLDLPGVQAHGLLNHTGRRLGRGLASGTEYGIDNVHDRVDRLSRFVVSTLPGGPSNPIGKAAVRLRRDLAPLELGLRTRLGVPLRTHEFDARHFVEFVWETLFSATLPPAEIGKIAAAGYRTLAPSWRSMHRCGLLGAYPTVDTAGYDVFLAQTPYPARVSPGTRLVVRYHDAIPMFQPHTIPSTRFHRKSHYAALSDNAPHAVFVCTSEASRSDLLRMFPRLEQRSPVIHDIVSNNYFVEKARPGAVVEIIRSRLNPLTEPKIGPKDKPAFYQGNLPDKARFLLMVSSIEPRKNHLHLLRAWERLRAEVDPDLKLVVVGTLGWDFDRMVKAFQPWQERGQLFHLSDVPSVDLRLLYGAATCVVCPSIAEGFDLSGIEAMLCGGVVTASDIPVHREVYGDASLYFDRYSVQDTVDTLAPLLAAQGGAARRRQLREHGLRRAERYKREAIAPQWADFFARLRTDPALAPAAAA